MSHDGHTCGPDYSHLFIIEFVDSFLKSSEILLFLLSDRIVFQGNNVFTNYTSYDKNHL